MSSPPIFSDISFRDLPKTLCNGICVFTGYEPCKRYALMLVLQGVWILQGPILPAAMLTHLESPHSA